MPFDLMNDQKDMTNFFARDNMDTFALACEGSGHCLLRAPIFSILGKLNFHCSTKTNIDKLKITFHEFFNGWEMSTFTEDQLCMFFLTFIFSFKSPQR